MLSGLGNSLPKFTTHSGSFEREFMSTVFAGWDSSIAHSSLRLRDN